MLPDFGKIIQDIQKEYEQKDDILAMLVTGSIARGEAYEGNDVDILFVGKSQIPHKEYRVGKSLVELGGNTLEVMKQRIEANPMQVYMYLDAKAVFDKGNNLEELQNKAQEVLADYHPSEEEINALVKWLESVVDKVTVANENDDMEKVSFVISTSLWKTIEGLYAINSTPTPASTSALRRIHTLKNLPPNFDVIWHEILFGNLEDRAENTLRLIDFVLRSVQKNSSAAK